MNKFGKIIIIFLFVIIYAVSPVFSQNLDTLKRNANTFSENMAKALPFYSTMGLNWSDAYIGKITDSPPHFGVGVSAGAVTMDFASMKTLLSAFNIDLPFGDAGFFENLGFPLPGYAAEARIGGAVLPFDVGLKFSYLPPSLLDNFLSDSDFGFKNMLIGADIRYAIATSKVLPVKFSAGLGFNYLQGGLTSALPSRSFSFNYQNKNYNLNSGGDSDLGVEWRTTSVELKTQVSLPYKIITPYLGAGVIYAWSQAGYKVTSSGLSITDSNGNAISGNEKTEIEELLRHDYLSGLSGTGFETINKHNGLNVRAFAGMSFNLAYVRLDLTGMYEFIGQNFGATIGIRFQL